MKHILGSPLHLFLYVAAQLFLLMTAIAYQDRVPMAIGLTLVLTIFLTSICFLGALFKKIIAMFRKNDSDQENTTISIRYPIAVALVSFIALLVSVFHQMGNERVELIRPAMKSDLIGEWRQRTVLDGERTLNRQHYLVAGPAFFRFNDDNTMTQVIVETDLPADDREQYLSFTYLQSTPYIHRFELNDAKDGLGRLIEQSGTMHRIWLGYADDLESGSLPKQMARYLTDFAPQKGDLFVGYLNQSGGVDYFRVLTRVDESYFNKTL